MKETIFKKDSKGKVRYYSISVLEKDNNGVIAMESGVLGGKPRTEEKVVSLGKNIGKSNETTPYEQAINEAQARFKKKLDEGYKVIKVDEYVQDLDQMESFLIGQLAAVSTDANNNIKPMLAQKLDKKRFDKIIAQPKIDGVRCLIFKDMNKRPQLNLFQDGPEIPLTAISRKGKSYNVPMEHIFNELQPLYQKLIELGVEDPVIDGEIYVHQNFVCDIGGLARRKERVDEHNQLEFHIFDLAVPKLTQFERLTTLGKAKASILFNKVKFVRSILVPFTAIDRVHKEYINDGYEGTIIRNADALYQPGKRSYDILKKKDYLEDEFKAVDIEFDRDRPAETLRFVLKLSDGRTFEASPAMPHDIRHEMVRNANLWYDKSMTVRFFNYTNDGIPFQPHVKRIRDLNYE